MSGHLQWQQVLSHMWPFRPARERVPSPLPTGVQSSVLPPGQSPGNTAPTSPPDLTYAGRSATAQIMRCALGHAPWIRLHALRIAPPHRTACAARSDGAGGAGNSTVGEEDRRVCLQALYNLCKVTKEQQTEASAADISPVLAKLVSRRPASLALAGSTSLNSDPGSGSVGLVTPADARTAVEMRAVCIRLLCLLAHSSAHTRDQLWMCQGLDLFMDLLCEQVPPPAATRPQQLRAIAVAGLRIRHQSTTTAIGC